MRACSARSAFGPPCAPTMRSAEAASGPPRAATAAAARATARHLLHRATRSEPALGLVPRMPLVGKGAAEPGAALRRALLLGLVHHQGAAAEVLPVQLGDRLLHLVGALQVDEGEAARPSRVAVGDDLDRGDRPSFPFHERADLLLGGVERQVSHVEAVAHVHLLRQPLYDRSAAACATSAPLWHLPVTQCRQTARPQCACATPPSAMATSPPSTTSRSTFARARCSAFWGPTARARRRSSAWSPASPVRPPARWRCSATTPCASTKLPAARWGWSRRRSTSTPSSPSRRRSSSRPATSGSGS